MTNNTAFNPNAFASTFAFLPTLQPLQKKGKELASQRTGHRRQLCILDTTHLRIDRRATDNKVLAKAVVTCFYDTFVINRTLVFKIKSSAETPRLRQYLNR